MVSVMSLWLPILLSALAVFFASFLLHTVLNIHANDYRGLPDEERVRQALRGTSMPPGEYVIPYAPSMAAMKDPAYVAKRAEGPNAFMTVVAPGADNMGAQLAQWFVFTLVVGIFAAYLTSRAVTGVATYGAVFRFAGTVAFASYALGQWQESIWFKRSWSTTLKNTFDGLVYALLTGGIFGWLWPA